MLQLPKSRSGLSSGDANYNAGGIGLLGSIASDDIRFWEEFFGVKYRGIGWPEIFDAENSEGSFKDWYDSATPEERAAAIKYTTSSYVAINKALREGDLDQAQEWIRDVVRNIDKAIDKFYLKQAITVWRGGSNRLIGGARTVEEINAMRGAIVIDKGVTSTAVTKDAAWIGDGKMGYEIVYPKGRGRGIFIDPVSENHGEQEFMVARNTRYEVLGAYRDSDGNTICRLKAIYGRNSRRNS